jgi:hypothetical protein
MSDEQFTAFKKVYIQKLESITQHLKSKDRNKILAYFDQFTTIDGCKQFIQQMEKTLGRAKRY